ncbi:hypothetical protein, partial [Dubosiella newyorkensis]
RLNFIILEFTHTEKPEKTHFSQVFVRDNSKLLLALYGLEYKFSVYAFLSFLISFIYDGFSTFLIFEWAPLVKRGISLNGLL